MIRIGHSLCLINSLELVDSEVRVFEVSLEEKQLYKQPVE